jgi:Tfp pilus assembly protein FimV
MSGHRSWLYESCLNPQTAMKIRNKSSLRAPVATLLCAAAAAGAEPATTDTHARKQKLERRVAQLAQQLQEVQAELKALMAEDQATCAARQAPPCAPVASSAPAMTLPAASSHFENLSLWGYGEIYYTHPGRDASLTEFDLARAVFGIGNKFDDRTLFNSEYEVEHAVSSAHDVGEFEVEQFYVDRQLSDRIAVRAQL